MKSLTQHFVYQKHISQSFVRGSVVFYDMNSEARKGNNGNRVLAMSPLVLLDSPFRWPRSNVK